MDRRLPCGAEVVPGGVHFRVFAPERSRVDVVIGERATPLSREPDGHFSGLVAATGAGERYLYRLDGGQSFPDPYSRFQPDGPHAPSAVADPTPFEWTDSAWQGLSRDGQVLYEMHVGTFTPQGSWDSAAAKLGHLKDIGVTAVEVMPVSEFPGDFGWGYDGVHPFAPTRLYGTPDAFRRFVDRAHAAGIGVILDVVYNHFGPDGNYLGQFSASYFTERYHTDWGAAINFECPVARELVTSNAAYWVREFHIDGLRLDAVNSIFDDSSDHIVAALTRAARAAAGERAILVIAEDDAREARMARPPERGGYGLDMMWNDDYHHAAVVALSGHNEGYYSDYHGSAQEFVSTLKYGYLFQGQRHRRRGRRLGTPALDLPPAAFVTFLENHDQVSNSGRGLRVRQSTDGGTYRTLTALTLLGPGTPMLFQGQEFGATTPFLFFADHRGELGRAVREGRNGYLSQFESLTAPEMRPLLADPCDRGTFDQCVLDWAEADSRIMDLHRDLLRLRSEDGMTRAPRLDGAVLGDRAFVLRFFGEGDNRLLVVNLGRDLNLNPAPEPLLAPPANRNWRVLWSSEDPRYGGDGTPAPESERNWLIRGHSALLLAPE